MSEKYALVTGSTKGIGKQIAEDLLKKEYFVILNYSKSDSDAAKTKRELTKISKKFAIIKADLSDLKAINVLAKKIKFITASIDYLVLNAGATERKPFEKLTIKDWNKVFNTNLTVPFFLIQKLNKSIRKNGRIIFIGSILGIVPHSVSIPYGISKAGAHILAKYLVKIFADRNITVNAVAPGFVDTQWQKNKTSAQRKNIENKIALKRFAEPEEISKTVMHIIDNGYINGQTIIIDGGYDYK